jgi:hypothetical protein
MSKSTSTVNPGDSRVNVVVRLVGIVFFVLGLAMTYETYVGATAEYLQPPLVPVLYLCSIMLTLAGLVAIIAKYKSSGTPKT